MRTGQKLRFVSISVADRPSGALLTFIRKSGWTENKDREDATGML